MKKILAISIFCALCMAGTAKDKNFKQFGQGLNFTAKNLSLQKHNTPLEVKSNSLFASTNEGERPFIKRAMFNMYIDWNFHLGASTDTYDGGYNAGFTWGGGMYFTFGARIYDYVFVGAGFGAEVLPTIFSGYDVEGFFNIPTFVNVRAFLPATSRIYPYIDIAAGPSCLFYLEKFNAFSFMPLGANVRVGVGVDFSRFSLGLGYEGIYYTDDYYTEKFGIHTFYLKFGIRIGAME